MYLSKKENFLLKDNRTWLLGLVSIGGGGSNEDWKAIECWEGIWKCVVFYREYACRNGKLDCLNSISTFQVV